MRGYLLDINVVSELRKQERADAHVRTWLREHRRDEFWLSVLVVGELIRGVGLLARRDRSAAAALTSWLSATVADYQDRILPVTTSICVRWGRLSVPDPPPVVDGLIAATALEHDLTLVTGNVADVSRTGVGVVNPFEPVRRPHRR